MIHINKKFPSLIKYMGSKTEMIEFITYGINMIHSNGQIICDLFAGSATISGMLRGNCEVISNDIQEYSNVLAKTYLSTYKWNEYPSIYELCDIANKRVEEFNNRFLQFKDKFNYNKNFNLHEFNELEKQQQRLIEFEDFEKFDKYYLFTKYYSGTYWSYDQCVWIDSIRYLADQYKNIEPLYVAILSSLMYAMAYNSQSTGHYAQYRDANTENSMEDILIYRRKSIRDFFERKFLELKESLFEINYKKFDTMTIDYIQCLNELKRGTLVYADPPYGSVHYSRFYHAIETLVKYDYPNVNYKGRYRDDRHQSPFCIKSRVGLAFESMFDIIRNKDLELVLSYSNSSTNTISLKELLVNACVTLNNIFDKDIIDNIRIRIEEILNSEIKEKVSEEDKFEKIDIMNNIIFENILELKYNISLVMAKHNHSTMGRKDDKIRQVKEVLIIANKIE